MNSPFPRLVLLAFISGLAVARADLTIVQKVDGLGDFKQMTIKFKGDKARIEISPEISTIVDGKTGDLLTIMSPQKMVMRVPGEQARALAEMAKQASGSSAPAKPKLIPTGRRETINGFDTQEFTTDSPAYQASYWIAPDFPDYADILRQMQTLQSGNPAAMNRGMPDFRDFPGMPIRTKIKIEGKGEMTQTIVSVKRDPLPDSDFSAPKDYKEMSMPALGAGVPHAVDKKTAPGP